jgi:Transposase, Mutator family
MRTVSTREVATEREAIDGLPERVQEALGELAGAAREGLLALSVGVGLGVLHEIVEAEVDEVVGPKGKHNPDRTAKRHGHEDGSVTLGGRRVPVGRPRVRTVDDEHEVALGTYRHFADRDPLSDVVLERMLAGVSTRRYARTGEPVGTEIDELVQSQSKSAVSREFVSRTRENLIELMSRPLSDLRLAVLMLDGIELKGRCCVVALGIDTDGVKHPLGLWDGSTENSTVATTLLTNLVERGLDVEQGVLCVIDGAKALRKAVRDVLGVHTPVQRCVRHKERNVLTICPSATDRPSSAGCAPPGRSTSPPQRSRGSLRWPASSTARIRAPRHRCARASKKRSPSPVSASAVRCVRRCSPPTRANRCSSASGAPVATSSTGRTATCVCVGPPPGCSKPSASSAA